VEFWEIITSLPVSNQKGNYKLAPCLEPEGKLLTSLPVSTQKPRSLSRSRREIITSLSVSTQKGNYNLTLSRTRREIITSFSVSNQKSVVNTTYDNSKGVSRDSKKEERDAKISVSMDGRIEKMQL
jgi:hypothetical protein